MVKDINTTRKEGSCSKYLIKEILGKNKKLITSFVLVFVLCEIDDYLITTSRT